MDVPQAGLYETVDDLEGYFNGRLLSIGLDTEVQAWAAREKARFEADFELLTRDDGFYIFLATFVSRENERLRAESLDRVPYDELRTEPLCTCSDGGCQLKHGVVPDRIRDGDATDPLPAILEYTLAHDGDPVVLDHPSEPLGARQVYAHKRSRAESVITGLLNWTENYPEEPPTGDDLDSHPYLLPADVDPETSDTETSSPVQP